MVTFLGAGPGDPELLTIKGAKALFSADVVICQPTVDLAESKVQEEPFACVGFSYKIPVTNALYAVSRTAGFDAQILHNVIATNDNMPEFMAAKICA